MTGIHRKQLPTFYNQGQIPKSIDWWKNRTIGYYNPDPKHQSQRQLQSQQNFFIKPDQLYLHEKSNDPAPADDFKKTKVFSKKITGVNYEPTEKPNAKLPPNDDDVTLKNYLEA